MVVFEGKPVTGSVKAPVPKVPNSEIVVPEPSIKPFVVLHSIPRSVTLLQLREVISAPRSAVAEVTEAKVGVFSVGAAAAIPLPETASVVVDAPPPPILIRPLYVATPVGSNCT